MTNQDHSLATNLYSKDTRFVYELIQNAEDNRYTLATREGQQPFLRFHLYPDRIILESNEDGFTKENVKAICSTGESTKSTTEGYIGEKGIGFKSVFKVAKRVHVQSGHFSFVFEYTRDSDDDGLGMVTPLDGEYEELETHVRTRITLTLLEPKKFASLVEEFLAIPESLLLFLTRLTTLEVTVHREGSDPETIGYRHEKMNGGEKSRIIKTATGRMQVMKDFYVQKNVIKCLPYDRAREFTNKAEIVLAFPVDHNNTPVLESQYTYAYLPIRKVGFNVRNNPYIL